MLPNAFIGRRTAPTDGDVSEALGPAKALWNRLVSDLSAERTFDNHKWNSYSPKAGWSLKLKRGERTILYLSPCKRCFRASFALGDKAVKAALDSKLPANVLKLIREAKRYAEGTAIRIEVNSPKDLDGVKKLVAAKLAK